MPILEFRPPSCPNNPRGQSAARRSRPDSGKYTPRRLERQSAKMAINGAVAGKDERRIGPVGEIEFASEPQSKSLPRAQSRGPPQTTGHLHL